MRCSKAQTSGPTTVLKVASKANHDIEEHLEMRLQLQPEKIRPCLSRKSGSKVPLCSAIDFVTQRGDPPSSSKRADFY